MTEFEAYLIELTHFLASDSDHHQGLNLREIRSFLAHPIKEKNNKTPEQCLRDDGLAFINELKLFIRQNEE